MELKIGERIKKFRKERDLTQEEVASHLGISFQAISKWERGDGYPDISTLPALANYFQVTVDELIGMEEIAAENRLEDYHTQWENNRRAKRHKENVALMREALKTYPNNAKLLVQLSASLERLEGSEAEKREYLKESIAVQEQILRYCDDSEVRGAVLSNISDAYYRAGNSKKALEYAHKLPNLYKTRETALVHILPDGKEKLEIAKSAMEIISWLLAYHLTAISRIEGNDRQMKKIAPILDLLYDEEQPEMIRSLKARAEKNQEK